MRDATHPKSIERRDDARPHVIPPLSIIVPFYNETAFLGDALASIVAQGIEGVEIIVVNDNPDIYSPDVLDALTAQTRSARDVTLRVVHMPENSGLSAARNAGLAQAKGVLIGFLDADDYYIQDGLRAQWRYACESGADITHGCAFLGDVGTMGSRVLPRDALLHGRRRLTQGLQNGEEAQFIVSSWSSLYRRAFLTENALQFDPAQRKFEDRLFVLESVTRARTIAYLGAPVRVWRRRAGSISVTCEGFETHLLQVQLLEKCLSVMRALTTADALPKRYEKRELFNCVSRLIWDTDLIAAIVAHPQHPRYQDLAARIPALLGDESFSHRFFDDAMVAKTSRVGMRTLKGRFDRTDFFALHRALREGQFTKAHGIMRKRAQTMPAAPLTTSELTHASASTRTQTSTQASKQAHKTNRRVVLHLGQHKTGSTYIQHQLDAARSTLAEHGILVPTAGWTGADDKSAGQYGTRDGALSGHQGLLAEIRSGDDTLWQQLADEVAQSTAQTIIISCENMHLPTDPDRAALITKLVSRLSAFGQVEPVAMIRNPADYTEAFWREWVAGGRPQGARSYAEFLVDYGADLLDLAQQFTPFERAAGHPVALCDFDKARSAGAPSEHPIWQAFCTLAKLPSDIGAAPAPRYTTPDRETVELLRIINGLCTSAEQRHGILAGFFGRNPQGTAPKKHPHSTSAISPQDRLDQIEIWIEKSAEFAATRGYSPDVDAWRDRLQHEQWQPIENVSAAHISALLGAIAATRPARDQAARRPQQRNTQTHPTAHPTPAAQNHRKPKGRPTGLIATFIPQRKMGRPAKRTVKLRARPWLRRLHLTLLDRFGPAR